MTVQNIEIWKCSHGSPIAILACTHITSLTDSSKVAKIAGSHKIVSVSTKGRFPAVVNSRFFFSWECLGGLLAWLWSGWIDCYHTALLKVCHHALPMLNHWLFSLSSFL